jgi:hypothetical protein
VLLALLALRLTAPALAAEGPPLADRLQLGLDEYEGGGAGSPHGWGLEWCGGAAVSVAGIYAALAAMPKGFALNETTTIWYVVALAMSAIITPAAVGGVVYKIAEEFDGVKSDLGTVLLYTFGAYALVVGVAAVSLALNPAAAAVGFALSLIAPVVPVLVVNSLALKQEPG